MSAADSAMLKDHLDEGGDMGISGAFLNELSAQRATALRDLEAARAAFDDGEASVALARLRDLDELLARSGSTDVRLDLEVDSQAC